MVIDLRLVLWFKNLFDKKEEGSTFPENNELTDELQKKIIKQNVRK